MLDSAVKERKSGVLILVALVVPSVFSLVALSSADATLFYLVNQGLKLLIMALVCWGAVRSQRAGGLVP